MGRALFVSGLLMLLSNFMFVILATQGHSPLWLTIAVATEQVTSGIGLTVFSVYLSGLANLAYTATQFALLSSVAVVGRTWLATPSGIAAEALGWPGFWVLTMVVALPGMLLLWLLWRGGYRRRERAPAGSGAYAVIGWPQSAKAAATAAALARTPSARRVPSTSAKSSRAASGCTSTRARTASSAASAPVIRGQQHGAIAIEPAAFPARSAMNARSRTSGRRKS